MKNSGDSGTIPNIRLNNTAVRYCPFSPVSALIAVSVPALSLFPGKETLRDVNSFGLSPVYNGAKYLATSIESILQQTHNNFELLISDDCSVDQHSGHVIQKYAKQDNRIKAWTNEKNLGHYPNYNACLNRASGKYIKLFAQDDLLHPEFLERFVYVMNQNPKVSLVNCARYWLDAKGNQIAATRKTDQEANQTFQQRYAIARCRCHYLDSEGSCQLAWGAIFSNVSGSYV